VLIVLKSGSLNLLEPSGPVKACNGIALPLTFYLLLIMKFINESIWERVGRVAQSVQRLTMGWTIWGSNPSGGEIFRTRSDRPWGPPSLLHNEYQVFAGDKVAVRGADYPPPSSDEVENESSKTVMLCNNQTILGYNA
jgi:hypothetical protein